MQIRCPHCQESFTRDDLTMATPRQSDAERRLFASKASPVHGPITSVPIEPGFRRWIEAHPEWYGDLATLLAELARHGRRRVTTKELKRRLRAQWGWHTDDHNFALLKREYTLRGGPHASLLRVGPLRIDQAHAIDEPILPSDQAPLFSA